MGESDPVRRFLLLCLRARHHPPDLLAAAELASSGAVDWDACERQAIGGRLAPLLHALLAGKGVLPEAVEESWRLAHVGNTVRNVLLYRELAHAVRLLRGAGPQAAIATPILLKGAALALSVYEEAGLRPMADIDLLVRREDLPRALEALQSGGYDAPEPEPRPGLAADFENELLLQRRGRAPIDLELHWGLLDSPHHQAVIPAEWFWETARPVSLEPETGVPGDRVLMLGPEAQLLHLCAHLALHHDGPGSPSEHLLWQNDIAEVLHCCEAQLDWELLLAKAAEYDLVLPLQRVLPAVVHAWDAPAPAGWLGRLAHLEPSAAERRVVGRLTAEHRPVVQRFYADLAGMPGWRNRLRYGISSLCPSPAYMQHRYDVRHKILVPLYYPYRWLLGLRSVASVAGR